MAELLVDARCACPRCETRTKATYNVPGVCLNCGATFTVLNRKGDKAPLSVDCPNCEVTVYGWRDWRNWREGTDG